MPLRILSIHMREMPVIEAMEYLQDVKVVGVGTGSYKKQDSQRILRAWRKAMGMSGGRRTLKPENEEQHRAMLSMIGIPFMVVKA